MKRLITRGLPAAAIVLAVVTTSLALAQNRAPESSDSAVIEDHIPPDVLQSEGARDLVERLRSLRRSEATMGKKHPSYRGIQADIEVIRRQLGLGPNDEDPFKASAEQSLPAGASGDLQQLIRSMSERIYILEKRVNALERRLEVF